MNNNPYLMIPQGNRPLRVRQLVLADTGTYDEQFRRPYQSNVDRHTIATLQERISTNRPVLPGAVVGLTDQIIQPQFEHEGIIQVAGGWGERRFRWFAIIEHVDRFGVSIFEIASGWTDTRGISWNGSINPDMVFHIGNILTMRSSTMPNAHGVMSPVFNIAEASQVLVNNSYQGVHTGHHMQHRLKPYDVYSAMDRLEVNDIMRERRINDTRAVMTTRPTKSRRVNAVPGQYVSAVIDGYRKGLAADEFGQAEDQVLDHAKESVEEEPVGDDLFLRAVASIRGMQTTSFFTWRDLETIDRNITSDEVTKVVMMGSPRAVVDDGSMYTRGQGAQWDASRGGNSNARYPQIATTIAQAVPSLMMSLGLLRVVIHSTNRTIGGQMITTVTDPQAAVELMRVRIDMSGPLQVFKDQLEMQLFSPLSFHGQTDYQLTIAADLMGETAIKMVFGGGTEEVYVVPSFADALLSPLVTANGQRLNDIARDFGRIFEGTFNTGQQHEQPVADTGYYSGAGSVDIDTGEMGVWGRI